MNKSNSLNVYFKIHFRIAVLLVVAFVPLQTIPHFKPPASWCAFAGLCNHTMKKICAKDSASFAYFEDVCGMFEYNCKQRAKYQRKDIETCPAGTQTIKNDVTMPKRQFVLLAAHHDTKTTTNGLAKPTIQANTVTMSNTEGMTKRTTMQRVYFKARTSTTVLNDAETVIFSEPTSSLSTNLSTPRISFTVLNDTVDTNDTKTMLFGSGYTKHGLRSAVNIDTVGTTDKEGVMYFGSGYTGHDFQSAGLTPVDMQLLEKAWNEKRMKSVPVTREKQSIEPSSGTYTTEEKGSSGTNATETKSSSVTNATQAKGLPGTNVSQSTTMHQSEKILKQENIVKFGKKLLKVVKTRKVVINKSNHLQRT